MGGSIAGLAGRVLAVALLIGSVTVSVGASGSAVPAATATVQADWTTARLVPNAGFEGSASAVDRWTVSGPTGSVSVVTAPVHGGGRAVRTVDASAAAGLSVRSETLAVRPGEILTAAVWANRVAGLSGTLYLEFWAVDGGRIDTATKSKDIANVAGWQQVSIAGTAPDGAGECAVGAPGRERTGDPR